VIIWKRSINRAHRIGAIVIPAIKCRAVNAVGVLKSLRQGFDQCILKGVAE